VPRSLTISQRDVGTLAVGVAGPRGLAEHHEVLLREEIQGF
jgi:hypothetical protein